MIWVVKLEDAPLQKAAELQREDVFRKVSVLLREDASRKISMSLGEDAPLWIGGWRTGTQSKSKCAANPPCMLLIKKEVLHR